MIHLILFVILLPVWAVPSLYTGGYWFKHSINKLKAELTPGQNISDAEISDAQLSAFMLGFLWPIGLIAIAFKHPVMKTIEAGAQLADARDTRLIQLADPHFRAALEEVERDYPVLDTGYIDAEYKERTRRPDDFWSQTRSGYGIKIR